MSVKIYHHHQHADQLGCERVNRSDGKKLCCVINLTVKSTWFVKVRFIPYRNNNNKKKNSTRTTTLCLSTTITVTIRTITCRYTHYGMFICIQIVTSASPLIMISQPAICLIHLPHLHVLIMNTYTPGTHQHRWWGGLVCYTNNQPHSFG